MQILFSDEKIFDIDSVYKIQNDRIRAPSRAEANKSGGVMPRRKLPQKVVVQLGGCPKGITPLMVFENSTLDHNRYVKEVLPGALKYENKTFGNDCTFQQNRAKPHIHHPTQAWCRDHFPPFIEKDRRSSNCPDLNPLDYCTWDEVAKEVD